MKTTKSMMVLASVFIVLFACKKENKVDDTPTTITKDKITGYLQKGPFTSGTQVFLYDLNNDLSPTGKSYNTIISNNSGSFEVKQVTLSSNYVSILANGFYYNEVLGELSKSAISLTALADVSNNTTVNVNVLTHLEKPRVEYLISTGKSFQEAKTQAQADVLKIFNINVSNLSPSELLNISQSSTGNAILLAVSCILQGYRTEAELIELLSNIGEDIKIDGVLSDTLGSELINHALYLDTISIRNNLVARYNSLGVSANIPHFEPYIANFIQNTTFPVTKPLISYPQNGLYGINCLYPNYTNLSCSHEYSFHAKLNHPNARLKVLIKRVSGNANFMYYSGSVINFNVSAYDFINNEQTFTSIVAGTDCDLKVVFQCDSTPGTFLIKYYEMNLDAPRWTKTISF